MTRTIWCPSYVSFSTKTLAPVSSLSALMLAPRGPMSRPVQVLGSAVRKTYSPGSFPTMVSASSGLAPLPPRSRSFSTVSTSLTSTRSTTKRS